MLAYRERLSSHIRMPCLPHPMPISVCHVYHNRGFHTL